MIQYLYLGRVGYEEGLQLQAEIAEAHYQGRVENVLLLLEHPPVLTLGRNADRANILASEQLLAERGVTLHEINRGGDVTYHGPGQLVGYPIFDLRSLRNQKGGRLGAVDFVRQVEEALIRLCGGFGVGAGRIAGLTGVWCGLSSADDESAKGSNRRGQERKIAAIGIHVARGITTHGFALNVTTDLSGFALINPCGITDRTVTSLEMELESQGNRQQQAHGLNGLPSLEVVADQTARNFGQVFDEQVLAVESLAALQAQGSALTVPAFPADDTPLRVPDEVERLNGQTKRSERA